MPVVPRTKAPLFLFVLSLGVVVSICPAPAAVSWNFEVRPILAAKCFACHGSDAGTRKAKLRLDDLSSLKNGIIIPGKPQESELIKRLHSTDPDEVMPPPEKSGPLTQAERATLESWIEQGAVTQKHWAFTAPVKPDIRAAPAGVAPIDYLIQKKLAAKNLRPAVAADRTDWFRRVSFALTGLPPSPEDIRQSTVIHEIKTDEQAAEAAFVDRLLASPHFGERLAQDWLDASRYGDTFGRHEDADSETWPWRDWVINAFNSNLPYDQFILQQTAGDMLANATQEQKTATTFNRLCVQSNESGSDPEEFRWDQVFDRVSTNATVFMGLTMACAQCHDHKYDPISRKEYYQFASFFNNIDELGLFSRYSNGTPYPAVFVYRDGEAAEHQRLQQAVLTAESELQTVRKEAAARYASWLRNNLPPGQGQGLWTAVVADPAAKSAALPRAPQHYFSFDLIDTKDKKFLPDDGHGEGSSGNVSLTPPEGRFGFGAGLPTDKDKRYEFPGIAEFRRPDSFTFAFWLKMLPSFQRGVILHRCRAGLDAANRGYELTLEHGRLTATLAYFYPGNAIRIETVEPVDLTAWKHVGWTYDGSSRAAGLQLYLDGKTVETRIVRDGLTRDIAYLTEWGDLDNVKVADAKAAELVTFNLGGRTLDKSLRGGILDDLKIYDCALSAPEIAMAGGYPTSRDSGDWLTWFQREIDQPCRAAAAKLHEVRAAENACAIKLRDVMVMQEQPGPRRATPMLGRGHYTLPGDLVSPGTPAALSPWPAGAPGDRRGLAAWLTASDHPLTARVQVNRLWRLFFGRGLVATGHDFGIQGSPPSHPELLDWLAVHFRESGWNIKQLCREIALSQTFRQSSTPADTASLAEDPDNRWLARGPRLRLPAEQIRDAALAVSGLLARKIGGPSVKPWQPPGLWEDSGTQHAYKVDTGDALHRRSIYTFWRRTCPPPLLAAFDAPSREFCLVQREESLTPLQTLAVLNDEGFLEAARAVAGTIAGSGVAHGSTAAGISAAFQQITGRLPSLGQTAALTKLQNEAETYYQTHPREAALLLKAEPGAGSAAVRDLDNGTSAGAQKITAGPAPARTAALMLVCRALFSSDEFLRSW